LDNVYGLIIDAPNISYFEKMAFIQDYYMSGEPYSNSLDFTNGIEIGSIEYATASDYFISVFDLDGIIRIKGKDCNCKVLMTLEVGKIQDGYVNLAQGNVSPSYPTGNNNVISEMNENYYKLWHSHSRMGASRYE